MGTAHRKAYEQEVDCSRCVCVQDPEEQLNLPRGNGSAKYRYEASVGVGGQSFAAIIFVLCTCCTVDPHLFGTTCLRGLLRAVLLQYYLVHMNVSSLLP